MADVSVITPLFNGASVVARCIESVAAQSEPVREHLVIDNGSTDGSQDTVRALMAHYPHVRLLHEERRGPGPARNAGIEAATGRYIAFLDCDDEWMPAKIERQVGLMEARALGFSWTGFDIVNEDGSPDRVQRVMETATVEDMLRKRVVLGCLTTVYDRERMGRLFLMNHLPLRQDFCLFLDLAAACEAQGIAMGGVDEPLARYWKSATSISKNKIRAAKAQWRAYREHFGFSRARAASMFASYAYRTLAVRL